MTLSVLRGEQGRQADELDQLIEWLKHDCRPDLVHLSNALLLGLARRMKSELGVPVVCSLQDEHTWVDAMDGPGSETIWQTMAERATDVDVFVAVSGYYADLMQRRLGIARDRLQVVHLGIPLEGYEVSALPSEPPVIGYLSRLSECLGLGVLFDAFARLKQVEAFRGARLRVTGGVTPLDEPYVRQLRQRLAGQGIADDVEIQPEFDRIARMDFLRGLTLLSVPVPRGEAFGSYIIEAMAAGVPVVQPRVGAFPEVIDATGGGIVYDPNDAETLAGAWQELLGDPERMRSLGKRGRQSVLQDFSIETMAARMLDVYKQI